MQIFTAGQTNRIRYDLSNRTTVFPIVAGTVNAYLQAMSGDNEGKWFRGSDSTWQATPSIAAVAAHDDDGHWWAKPSASAWLAGVRYHTYAKESGDLHISVSEEVVDLNTAINVTMEPSVEQ
jgi:hypothetical protein